MMPRNTAPHVSRLVAKEAGTAAFYLGLVAWLTWPLATSLGTRVPATNMLWTFDARFEIWALAWESHALVTAPTRLAHANIYHPTPYALFYGPPGFGVLPYFAPVFLATGNPALAINVTFLVSIALTAWALHLVVARWTGSNVAGFVAACAFLANRWLLWAWVPGVPQYSVLQFFPLIVLLASRVRVSAWLVPLVVFQSLADPLYIAPAVFAPLGVLAIGRLIRRDTRSGGWRLVGLLGLALLALTPVAAGFLAVRRLTPHLDSQTPYPFRPDVAVPPLVFGALGSTDVPTPALAVILLGGLAFLLRRRAAEPGVRTGWAHAALWAAVGIYIALPPRVLLDGWSLRLPQWWLPITRYWRTTANLGTAGLMGLALLTGLAFAECARLVSRPAVPARLRPLARSALAALLLGALYAAYQLGRDPIFPRPPLPSSYQLGVPLMPTSPLLAILRRPGGPLLELPAENIIQAAQAMYRSIFHWRPLLNGYASYWPEGFSERMALARRLPDADALATLRAETDLELILVHADPGAPKRAAWLELADRGGREDLRLLARDGPDLLFIVAP